MWSLCFIMNWNVTILASRITSSLNVETIITNATNERKTYMSAIYTLIVFIDTDTDLLLLLFFQVLKLLTCSDERNYSGGCENGQFMSNSQYKTVEAYTNSIQGFLNVYPGMESLVECQTVKDAFSKILENHCKPLEKYANMVWGGLVFVSVVMVCLVLIWTIRANFEQKLHLYDGSVQPNSSTPPPPKMNIMEMANNHWDLTLMFLVIGYSISDLGNPAQASSSGYV